MAEACWTQWSKRSTADADRAGVASWILVVSGDDCFVAFLLTKCILIEKFFQFHPFLFFLKRANLVLLGDENLLLPMLLNKCGSFQFGPFKNRAFKSERFLFKNRRQTVEFDVFLFVLSDKNSHSLCEFDKNAGSSPFKN